MQKTNVQEKAEYLIGDVARMVGLSRDALRFYEKKGIINARKKDNGYRYYSEDEADVYPVPEKDEHQPGRNRGPYERRTVHGIQKETD